MDILQWLVGKKCVKVQSFGHLSYFKRQNAPKGAPQYCIEGCPNGDTCPYNAVKLYLESDSKWFRDSATREVDPSDEMVKEAITKTQYGKCVFKCDNDVVDHQTVNMHPTDTLRNVCYFITISGKFCCNKGKFPLIADKL